MKNQLERSRRQRNNKHRNRYALPGFSLLYVLFLLTMLAMILAGFITFRFYSQRQSLEWIGRTKAERNLISAITLLRDSRFVIQEGHPLTISLFNDGNDSVTLIRKRWGLFDLLEASSRFKNITFYRTALCGDYHHRKNDVALLLGNCNKPLCLCGNTRLKGTFNVPKAGIKTATIAGRFYQRNELVEGVINAVDRQIPDIKARYLRLQPKDLLRDYAALSRAIKLKSGSFIDSLNNSFKEPTVVLYAKQVIRLEGCVIKGNVIVISDSVIVVAPSAKITDAILCAKNIFIESKFKGTGQFIATDSLLCGPLCTFPNPSILAVINGAMDPVPFLFLDKRCLVEGSVITYSEKPIKPLTAIGLVREQSVIIGSFYTNCEFSLSGEIHGNVIAPGFILRSPTGIYQNYLMDAVIDYSRQPDYFTGISYQKTVDFLHLIKWLQ